MTAHHWLQTRHYVPREGDTLVPKHVAEHPDTLSYYVMLAFYSIRVLVFQMVPVLRVFLPKLCMRLWYLPSVPHVIPISSALFNHSNRSKIMSGEEHRLRVFENRVRLKVFVITKDEVTDRWVEENCTPRSFTTCTVTECHSGDQVRVDEMIGAGGMCAGQMHREFWWGNLRKDPGVDEMYVVRSSSKVS